MNRSMDAHLIPGTAVAVDAFSQPVSEPKFHYVLTHFHGDHYGRLSDRWDATVHCSELTGRLITHVLGVRQDLVVTHCIGEEFVLGGARVLFADAEHCPGAVMVLATPEGSSVRHLHTGDCRATPQLLETLRSLTVEGPSLGTVLLDTTYALAKRSFPPQSDSVAQIAADISGTDEDTVVAVATYGIGKERAILQLADRLGAPIYTASERKRAIWRCMGLGERLAESGNDTRLHVIPFGLCCDLWPYFRPKWGDTKAYLAPFRFRKLVAIVPTGHADASNWNRKHQVVTQGDLQIRLYPYSEHSSPAELDSLLSIVRPSRIVPTVFRDEKGRLAVLKRFHRFVSHASAAKALFGARPPSKRRALPSGPAEAIDVDSLGEDPVQAAPKRARARPATRPATRPADTDVIDLDST